MNKENKVFDPRLRTESSEELCIESIVYIILDDIYLKCKKDKLYNIELDELEKYLLATDDWDVLVGHAAEKNYSEIKSIRKSIVDEIDRHTQNIGISVKNDAPLSASSNLLTTDMIMSKLRLLLLKKKKEIKNAGNRKK